jgi:hypothetical protein
MFSVAGRIVSDSIRASDGAKSFGAKKDLLSVLLKANLSKDIPESQRLSDTEVVSRRCLNFGIVFVIAPCLNISRDSRLLCRWPRNHEVCVSLESCAPQFIWVVLRRLGRFMHSPSIRMSRQNFGRNSSRYRVEIRQ